MLRDHLRSFQKLSLHTKDLWLSFYETCTGCFFQRLHLRFDVMHVLTKEFKKGNQVSLLTSVFTVNAMGRWPF